LFNARVAECEARIPEDPRSRLRFIGDIFIDFAMEDIPRSQLMNVRVLPDFSPSEAAYRPAVECFERLRAELRQLGITRDTDVDLFTALIGGLVTQQQANEPGGRRWRRLLPRVIDMYADAVGLPARPNKSRRKS
jgi:hypothetical protein